MSRRTASRESLAVSECRSVGVSERGSFVWSDALRLHAPPSIGAGGMACHSLLEAEGGTAGAAGARLAGGWAQHAGVEQLPERDSQHLHTPAGPEESWLATAEQTRQPVMLPSN